MHTVYDVTNVTKRYTLKCHKRYQKLHCTCKIIFYMYLLVTIN